MKEPSVTKLHSASTNTRVYSQNAVLAAIGLLVLLALSFYVGTLYQKSHNLDRPVMGLRTGGRFEGLAGHHPNIGTVTSVSSDKITVTALLTNATKTYTIDSNTKVLNNGQSASVSDIKTGDRVIIRTSGAGSATATQIDINPSFGGGLQPGGTASST